MMRPAAFSITMLLIESVISLFMRRTTSFVSVIVRVAGPPSNSVGVLTVCR
jgi:hypothetical protein